MTVINGIEIDSNKQIDSIVNTRVNFTDGSWCDVSTGQVVNKGGGYINIGGGQMESGEKEIETFGPRKYRANSVDVQSVSAEVDIQPISGNEITVSMKGLKSVIEDISVDNNGEIVTIKGKKSGGRKGGISISGSGNVFRQVFRSVSSCVSIQGNNISINSGGSNADVKISVGVPEGSAVRIAGVDGDVNIGDTFGSLDVNVLGGSDVRAGSVVNANLSIQGSGDVNVKSVDGNLAVNIQGSGDVMVRKGSVDTLGVNVMGSGDATFKGRAVNANLSVMGSGDIDVAYVENRPVRSVMGSGDIDVGNW